ncbi:uncharacterized protein LOC109594674 [Aethina tumida]|uniref:uncharacterized protein LOC109594674 n=1 Tax=Aethina tumida TaxID=116153 RepID=UPI00096B2D14|nr:uncharacterized protein LOC109594674 [Aethina tumida]
MMFGMKTAGLFVVLLGIVKFGDCIRCYECSATLGPHDNDPCYYGDESRLRRVHCIGPSVCGTYHYEKHYPNSPTEYHVTRGCQSIGYGSTCEDIFNNLRAQNAILPGQHSCTTCSNDYCNSSIGLRSGTVFIFALLFQFWRLLRYE